MIVTSTELFTVTVTCNTCGGSATLDARVSLNEDDSAELSCQSCGAEEWLPETVPLHRRKL
jgi:uncharacterized Zn finger protein